MIRKQEGTFLSEADGLEISALCIMPEEKDRVQSSGSAGSWNE